MKKTIPYEKLSKRQKKALNDEQRLSWGQIKPTTKVIPSKKLYKRTTRNCHDPFSSPGCFLFGFV